MSIRSSFISLILQALRSALLLTAVVCAFGAVYAYAQVGVEVPVQSHWVYVTANAKATQLKSEALASTASLQKITDHPLVYGAFEVSP